MFGPGPFDLMIRAEPPNRHRWLNAAGISDAVSGAGVDEEGFQFASVAVTVAAAEADSGCRRNGGAAAGFGDVARFRRQRCWLDLGPSCRPALGPDSTPGPLCPRGLGPFWTWTSMSPLRPVGAGMALCRSDTAGTSR